MSQPGVDNTCAIVVTHFPDASFPERLAGLLAQFPLAVVIDNGSHGDALAMLHALAAAGQIDFIANPTNLGIAAALNQGVRQALTRGFAWAVTMDQDTVADNRMRETLTITHAACQPGDVIVGGNFFKPGKQLAARPATERGAPYIERKTLITSGMLLPLALAERLGGFRADYFIDSVDHEFCLRARAGGCRIIMTTRAVMTHRIGDANSLNGWRARFSAPHHGPVRKYFIARNTTLTMLAYATREPRWALRQLARLPMEFVSMLVFEKNRIVKAKAYLVGIAHGIAGRTGAIESAWPEGRD